MSDKGSLLRVLGVAFGIAAVIGGTIGQGILRQPGPVANAVPNASWIIALWLAGGVFAAIDACSTVELATSVRRTGGPYSFARAAFGPLGGLATGFADCLGYAAVVGFISIVFAEFLHRFGIATTLPIGLIAVVEIAVLAAIQAMGTRIAGWSQEAGSAFKALVFVILIVALLLSPRGEPVAGPAISPPLTMLGFIFAARSIAGAYTGWNASSYFAEEVTDLRKGIVVATFSGIALVTTVFVLVNVAVMHMLTVDEMGRSTLAVADAAGRVFGPVADTLVNAVALLAVVTILNMFMMVIPRVLFAIGRDNGITPLARVAQNGTPMTALLILAAVGALLASSGTYLIVLQYATWLYGLVAVAVNVAAITLRRRAPEMDRPWKMPLYPLPAILALGVNSALLAAYLYETPMISLQATAILAVVTLVVFVATGAAGRARAEAA